MCDITADPRVHETPDYDSGFRFPDYEPRFSQFCAKKEISMEMRKYEISMEMFLAGTKLTESRFVIRKSKSGNVIRSLMYAGISCKTYRLKDLAHMCHYILNDLAHFSSGAVGVSFHANCTSCGTL